MGARIAIALLLGLFAALAALLGTSAVWGLTVEYGRGTDVLVLAVVVPTALATLALLLWPGLRDRVRLLVPVAVAAGLLVAGLGAEQVGLREREQRSLAASARFGCHGPHAEVRVPGTVEETWAELPRPAPLYGPVEGTPEGCTAAISGDPDAAFDAWAGALRGLDGWRVVRDDADLVVLRRADGTTVVLARGDVATLRVSTRRGTLLGQTSDELVTGPNRPRR